MSDPVNFVDPSGLYDRLVHYALTLQLALKSGFSRDEAYRIAAADQGIDDNSDTGPYDKDGGPEYHFSSHNVALSKMNSACNVDDLGEALHRLQDSYSHAGYTWASGGHIRDGVKPDIYDSSSVRDRAMRSETLRMLMTYRKLRGGM
jgi:hypothetical protein